MTKSHNLIERLQRRGLRVTPQRAMIIEALAQNETHMTAEQIFARVKDRSSVVNIATVYRTLELLVSEGFASRSDFHQERAQYAINFHGRHIHLVCRQCGAMLEASPDLLESVDDRLVQQYHFSGDLDHLTITGVCSGCQRRNLFLEA